MADQNVWLVGAGEMGIEYAKVLKNLHNNFITISRGETNASKFEEATGSEVITGGVEQFLKGEPEIPEFAIIAVDIENLAPVTTALMEYGVKKILLEKPGVGYPDEIDPLVKLCKDQSAKVYLAYNRRFYASVRKAKMIIEEDEGVSSLVFEFTEWSHLIATASKKKAEHHNWFIGNSTHVVDTAFYLAGKPIQLNALTDGGLDWHPSASVFAGSGKTDKGVLFSYHANWAAPGRWWIEFLTKKHRLIFRPMEELKTQEIGSVEVRPVDIDDEIDKKYKPGLFLQTKAFLENNTDDLCDLQEQKSAMVYYKKMGNY